MRIPVDSNSPTPLYQQIETHLRKGILSGSLAAETRLSSARELATDLKVSRITVENAYAELEAAGLVERRLGSGTYVLAQPGKLNPPPGESHGPPPWPLWQQEAQERSGRFHRPALDEWLRSARHPNPINFAGGVADPRFFPADEFRRAVNSVLRRDGTSALEYGRREGYEPLRRTIAKVLGSQGLNTKADNVLITSGSQQALTLIAQLLLRPGEVVLVENPTYAGALDLFRALDLRTVGIPMDSQGMQVERLEPLLQQHHPKLLYTIPNFHNPTGTCLSTARRKALITLADRYNLPILEDDFVGDMRYEGRAQPSLKSMDAAGRVLYVSTFSKMLMPGLRVAFLVAEGPVYQSLVSYKAVVDLATSNLMQRSLEAYVTVGRYRTHLRRTCRAYRRRRDCMIAAIQRYLPSSVQYVSPAGGMFFWLQLPPDMTASKLLTIAVKEGVGFATGTSSFVLPAEGESFIRLNFISASESRITEGIQRLAKAMQAY